MSYVLKLKPMDNYSNLPRLKTFYLSTWYTQLRIHGDTVWTDRKSGYWKRNVNGKSTVLNIYF